MNKYVLKVVFAAGLLLVLILSYFYFTKEEYRYSFDKSGIPTSRMKLKDGSVEVYSNIRGRFFNDKMLHNIHQKLYADLEYDYFYKLVQEKYENFEFKTKDEYRWIDFNENHRIELLNEFTSNYRPKERIDIFNDKDFQSLDLAKKQKIANNYFDKEMTHKDFYKLDIKLQSRIREDFVNAQIDKPLP